MKAGDLVKFVKAPSCKTTWGLFLGYKASNGYTYSEVLWFHGIVSNCQSDLLMVINESR
jgi:hypothetical protein